MEGQQFPPELLQREVRERLGGYRGTLLQQNFPTSRQLAGDIRGLFAGGDLDEAVARANRNRRVNEIQRVQPLFDDERPSNQEALQRTATPPTAPAPAPSPEYNLRIIKNTQAMNPKPTTYYYQKDKGIPSLSARKTQGFDYIDKEGLIGDNDRFPTGVPRVWRLLETKRKGGGVASVLALRSEMREDGTFPQPENKGTHRNRATMGMTKLQDFVDGGQIGISRDK
tara:strand:- start:1127 stop:1804 length:678 start_codon:yes stop_codon:yes gene_type:complete